MKSIYLFIMSLLSFLLSGCHRQNIQDYAHHQPTVDLRTFFQGQIEGWGTLFDWQGRQTRSFYVDIRGQWQNQTGTLEEDFIFDDGEKTHRTWTITFKDDQHFYAQAADVVGEAIGEQLGHAIHLNYTLRIPYQNKTLDLKMDDWMYLVQPDVILNRTAMKKWGIKVGEIMLVMKKKS